MQSQVPLLGREIRIVGDEDLIQFRATLAVNEVQSVLTGGERRRHDFKPMPVHVVVHRDVEVVGRSWAI